MNIKNFIKILIIFSLLSYFLVLNSQFASAVDYIPLVPCGLKAQPVDSSGNRIGDPNIDYTRPCTKCDAFKLTENVIDFGLQGVVPPVAAVLFIAAGLMILLAGANQKLYATGIAIFKDTFWGLVIILASWMIVNTFIQSFGPDQVKGSWFKFTCQNNIITGPGGPGNICFRPQKLAAQYGAPYPYPGDSPELNQLISCVNSRLGSFIDQSQLYTYEGSNNLCNYSKGNTVCGACQHTVNSCHYGGSQGSQAVDFNAKGITEQDLYQRLQGIYGACRFGYILFENTHTHVSTQSCPGN